MKYKIMLVLLFLSSPAFAVVQCPFATTAAEFVRCSMVYKFDAGTNDIIDADEALELESMTAPGKIWTVTYTHLDNRTVGNRFDVIIKIENHDGSIFEEFVKDKKMIRAIVIRARRDALRERGGGPPNRGKNPLPSHRESGRLKSNFASPGFFYPGFGGRGSGGCQGYCDK